MLLPFGGGWGHREPVLKNQWLGTKVSDTYFLKLHSYVSFINN